MTTQVNITADSGTTIDDELVGEALAVGDVTLKPVARRSGKRWSMPAGQAGQGKAGFVHISPTAVVVQYQDETEERLPLPIPSKQVLYGMLTGAAAFAASCIGIMMVASIWAWRSSR